jgi:hypothetical protein
VPSLIGLTFQRKTRKREVQQFWEKFCLKSEGRIDFVLVCLSAENSGRVRQTFVVFGFCPKKFCKTKQKLQNSGCMEG